MAGVNQSSPDTAFGPLKLRMPFAADDRKDISEVKIDGEYEKGWTQETMVIRGKWQPDDDRKLRMRPIFPGTLRFVAEKPEDIPELEDIPVTDGRVDDDFLDVLSLRGRVIVQPKTPKQLKDMRALPRVAAYGLPPAFCIYDAVWLDAAFLREAVLDPQGFLSSWFMAGNEKIKPGNPKWERLALHRFLKGAYAPAARAKTDSLGSDDADRVSMPAVDVAADGNFTLKVHMGTACDCKTSIDGPGDRHSRVPAMLFMRYNKAGLREVFDENAPDPVVKAMLIDGEGAGDADQALRDQLRGRGFGDEAGAMPLEAVIREFQIAAKDPIVAKGKPGVTEDQLAKRDYRDLVVAKNDTDYTGPISGIINDLTRVALENWEKNGWRSPLLIVVFETENLGPESVPVIQDIWAREEVRENSFRMFAADLTRLNPGESLDYTMLELIGYYSVYPNNATNPQKHGGPASFKPSAANRVDFAEVTPKRMVDLEQDDLIAALQPANTPLTATASTFRVVRAVSEMECLGYLDQINAYDNAGISFGPCHWAMAGAIGNPSGGTELGAFAAYLRSREKMGEAGIDVFEPQGLRAIGNGDPGWSSSNAAFYAPLGFIDDCGSAREMERSGPKEMIPAWRTFYRWVRIGRAHRTVGLASWSMAVMRLHSLLKIPVKGTNLPADLRQSENDKRTIGSVFTSELTVAVLMRWHVKYPKGVVEGSGKLAKASDYLIKAYKEAAAGIPAPSGANGWQAYADAWERNLFAKLRAQIVNFNSAEENRHAELPGQTDQLKTPNWINMNVDPPVAQNNTRAYALDPRLRVLERGGGTFKLAVL